jgi:hypothetical protein
MFAIQSTVAYFAGVSMGSHLANIIQKFVRDYSIVHDSKVTNKMPQ